VAVFSAGQLGQYYDVQGSSWSQNSQPQLDSPDQTVKVGGRTYYLYYSGHHLRIVAWIDGRDEYWVHNTLSDSLGNGELLAIAEQTVPISGARAAAVRGQVFYHKAKVPIRLNLTSSPSLRKTAGAIAGAVAIVLLPALLFLLWRRRRRDVRQARGDLAVALATSGRLAPVGGYGSGAPAPGGLSVSGQAPAEHRRVLPLVLGGLLILVVGAALGLALTFAGSRVVRSTHHHHHKRPVPGALTPPAVPVVVLNSTSVAHAADKLSLKLRSQGAKIAGVGNVAGPRPAGVQVLYAPGERTQAERLAALLAKRSPSIAPLDPVAAGAAGANAKLVVVIG
jgi:hypothetical protein